MYWTPIAELVMEYAPQLYNPLPSTFNSRTTHIDGGYEITEPIIYVNQDGYVRKVLLPTSLGRDALDNLAVGGQDQDIFNAECEKIDESKSEYCYLNFPHGTEITMAEPYILGTEILFTNENDGRKYFTSGISAIEGDFAWSDGMTSNMTLNIGEVNQDITAEINFKGIYNGSQALVITSHGRELFNQVVTPDNPSVSFVIPQEIIENGVVDLELSYPNAARPSDSGSSDTRLLAFAWERISFQKVDE